MIQGKCLTEKSIKILEVGESWDRATAYLGPNGLLIDQETGERLCAIPIGPRIGHIVIDSAESGS